MKPLHPRPLTQSRWVGYMAVAAGVCLLVALLIYALPGSAAPAADWHRPDSALAQGWLHIALAAAFLLVAPLPATIAHTWRMPHGAIDRTACTAGQVGSLIFALIMCVQAAGWFEASAVSAGTSAEVRTAVASALYYNNQVLGGLVEFLVLALVAVWFAWVGMRAGSLPPLMRVVCLAEAALIITGQWAGFMAIPLVASCLGVSVIRIGCGRETAS